MLMGRDSAEEPRNPGNQQRGAGEETKEGSCGGDTHLKFQHPEEEARALHVLSQPELQIRTLVKNKTKQLGKLFPVTQRPLPNPFLKNAAFYEARKSEFDL